MKELEPYRVYVPADEVEVEGVIQVARDVLAKELLCEGFGKFEHPNIPTIRPVDAFRFSNSKKLPDGKVMRVGSEFVKITFPGKALPQYFVILHCDKCGRLDHTELFCNNKPKCRKCDKDHTTGTCNKTTNLIDCNLCKGSHSVDMKTCPKYQQATRNRRLIAKTSAKKSYAELVRRMGGFHTQTENVYDSLSECGTDCEDEEYLILTNSNPRKRRRAKKSSDTRHL